VAKGTVCVHKGKSMSPQEGHNQNPQRNMWPRPAKNQPPIRIKGNRKDEERARVRLSKAENNEMSQRRQRKKHRPTPRAKRTSKRSPLVRSKKRRRGKNRTRRSKKVRAAPQKSGTEQWGGSSSAPQTKPRQLKKRGNARQPRMRAVDLQQQKQPLRPLHGKKGNSEKSRPGKMIPTAKRLGGKKERKSAKEKKKRKTHVRK